MLQVVPSATQTQLSTKTQSLRFLIGCGMWVLKENIFTEVKLKKKGTRTEKALEGTAAEETAAAFALASHVKRSETLYAGEPPVNLRVSV